MNTSKVAYPGTYNNTRSTYGSAQAAVGATVPGHPAYNPGAFGNNPNNQGPRPGKKTKQFCCSNKHPVMALKTLRQDIKFEVVCSYATTKGCALVYTTLVDGIVYQGEGTSASIAKAIAATKALAGINAVNHHMVDKVADYEEQKQLVLERIQIWQEMQAAKEEKKKMRELKENEPEHANKKKKENNGTGTPMQGGVLQRDFGYLKQRFGPDVKDETTELEAKDTTGCFFYKCVLTVQGNVFEAQGRSKKAARNASVDLAFAAFDVNPPLVVNERKHKTPKKSDADFKPIEPATFQDKLAEKCWEFVSEKTVAFSQAHKSRRNLVVIVKVEGEEDVGNCEVVAFGSGTLLVKKEKMTTDGSVINDCTGESLALRALRRYLLDQIELCLGNRPSVYSKERGSPKCALKKTVSFVLYTNSSPMGDCRAVNHESLAAAMETPAPLPETPAALPLPDGTPTPMETDQPKKKKSWQKYKVHSTPDADMGKITFAKALDRDGSSEVPILKNDENAESCHCIVSPSDKLAVRQMCGVQGSILFNLSTAVYISQYAVNRSFNEDALTRALYGRVKDANLRGTSIGVSPTIVRVIWKASRMPEKKSMFALIWAKNHSLELLYSPSGKQVTSAQDQTFIDVSKIEELNIMAMSEYCTKAMYTALSNVCSKNKKPYPQKYSVMKSANTRYRTTKTAVLNHLKDTGMGSWGENANKPDY